MLLNCGYLWDVDHACALPHGHAGRHQCACQPSMYGPLQTDDGAAAPATSPQGADSPTPPAPSSPEPFSLGWFKQRPSLPLVHAAAEEMWDERPAMDPEDATHCLRVIQNDDDPQRRAFALGAMSTLLATCAVFPGVKSDRMLAETLRTLRDRVPWGADEPDRGEDHRD